LRKALTENEKSLIKSLIRFIVLYDYMIEENKPITLEGLVKVVDLDKKYGVTTLYALLEDRDGVLYNTYLSIGGDSGAASHPFLEQLSKSLENQRVKVEVQKEKIGDVIAYKAISQYQILKS
jgi:hypothetical protein